jgi:diguanylate cyclase (GGDEF)-like protein/PAS domain S-box-containing protein
MDKKKIRPIDKIELRRQAEELSKEINEKEKSYYIEEADIQRLMHELQVHQIELEMQNEQLREAHSDIEEALKKYEDLYDFAPVGYFSLDQNGVLLQINLTGAQMLGLSRSQIKDRRLVEFILEEKRLEFYKIIKKVFDNQIIKSFESILKLNKNKLLYVHIEVRVSGDSKECHLAMVDITERKKAEEALQKSKEELRSVVELSQHASYKRNLASDKYDYLSPVIENITGYAQEEMINMPMSAVFGKVHPDDLPQLSQVIKESIEGGNTDLRIEYRFLCKDRNYRWFVDRTVLVKDGSGKSEFLYGTFQDINERKILEIKLKESENSLRITTDGARVGLWDWMVKEGKTVLNEQWAKMLGYSLEELSPLSIDTRTRLTHPDDLKKSDELLKKVFSKELEYYECEVRMKHKDGKWVWVLTRGQVIEWDKDKNPIRMAGTHTSIDRIKKTEEEILYQGYHDAMTGLYNRTFFEEEKKRLDTNRQLPLSVIMGDLNGLKLINDAFGHNEGDKIIKEAAEILKRACRSDDIVARWGGDEFVVLLPKTSASGSEEILERIKKECEKTISQKIPLSLSLGTATKEEISQPIDLIITDSESNMYKNKLGERENISNSIRTALEQALYEKSNETADHTGRIKELALKLGRRVKLTSSQLDDLSILASLHDIGKVAIPEKILMKKGKLTEKEWEIIKRHPVVGFNIAIASTQIVHVAKSILACHEHWDGSGYPNGLKGESAPIASRIILIADAYEVMTSGRTYKKPISKDEAIKELKRCSGTQFDPMLVNEFIEIISRSI